MAGNETDRPTIEELIAEWYAKGRAGDALHRFLEDAVWTAIRKTTSTFCPRVRREVEDGALGHVWEQLNARKFKLEQTFAPWCNQVIKNLAISITRKAWFKRVGSLNDGGAHGEAPPDPPDTKPAPDSGTAIDPAAAQTKFLRRYEQALPAPLDRIILAVYYEYAESVPDAVLAGWCQAAGLGNVVARLREIQRSPEKGRYQQLEAVVGLRCDNIRQKACRAKKQLKTQGFS